MAPAPNRYHQDISRNLEFILMRFLATHPVGLLYSAPFDVCLGEHNVFQPDKIFVSNDRKDILTDAGAEGAPNLVIEILSPSSALLDKQTKRKVYAAAGVEELWLIDPEEHTIARYRLQVDPDRPDTLARKSDTFGSPCFPGLELRVAEVFKR